MPTRSAVLGKWVSSGTPLTLTLATVPSTDTWIVKSVNLYNAGGVPATVGVWVLDPVTGAAGYLVLRSLAVGEIFEWSGWVAAGPNHVLRAYTDVNNVLFWVSGAELPGHV
jgi:hypothetical protein